MLDEVERPCPICGENHLRNSESLQSGVEVRNICNRCGNYDIAWELVQPGDKPWSIVSHLVSAWVRRENEAGKKPVIPRDVEIEDISNPDLWESRFRYMGFPETTIEKIDALLIAYANSIEGNYNAQFSFGYPRYIADVAARNQDEINGLNRILDELGYIDKDIPRIKADDWLHLDELRKTIIASDTAFIAMWFNQVTDSYRETVSEAVLHCGYRPIIIDQEQYSGFIMDQVIASLKQAKFIIADFTCRPKFVNDNEVKNGVRGGVYWESGMAYGLGKPLIHTCENSLESKERIHFDVDQYNTIYWDQDELGADIRSIEEPIENPNFAEKLVARILKLVGKGSYVPE